MINCAVHFHTVLPAFGNRFFRTQKFKQCCEHLTDGQIGFSCLGAQGLHWK